MLFTAVAVGGCAESEPERAAVSGQVTFQGQPVEQGKVLFFSKSHDGAPAVAAAISNGQFALSLEDGPFVGHNRIEISAYKKTGRQIPDLSRENQNNPDRPMVDEVVPILPSDFNMRSQISREIMPGDNTAVDFNL